MRRLDRIKPFTCSACGATNQHPPVGPYVDCESCGTLIDFDGNTARRSPDWFRSLLFEKQAYARGEGQLRRVIEAGDREAWKAILRHIVLEQIARFPSQYPRHVADAAWRDRFVNWKIASDETLYWERETQRWTTAMAMIEVPIARAVANSAAFWRRTEVAEKLYEALERADRVLGNRPPDRVPDGFLRRMNRSLYVQEWLPDLAEADAAQLLARTGLDREYVIAHASDGDYTCVTCGAAVHLDDGATLVMCPYCRSALRPTEAAPTIGPRQWAALVECDDGMAQAAKHARKLARVVIADGTARGLRVITIQAIGADGVAHEFCERELRPELPFADFLHAWAELEGGRRKLPVERRWLREHAQAPTPPRGEAELDARLAALDPPVGARRAEVVARGTGCACDVIAAADPGLPWTLRLAADDDQRNAPLYRRWAAAFNER